MQDDSFSPTLVRVKAPARLHLGFLDLKGHAGRKFGSIGMAINAYSTHIEVSHAEMTTIINNSILPQANLTISALLKQFYATLGRHIPLKQRGVKLTVLESIPEHTGLGSGTQIALTVGTALCRLHQIAANTWDIAVLFGRGSRSGIGIATFDYGGFIIDGGVNDQVSIPPILARLAVPEDWRIVLISDSEKQGIHGEQERMAFTKLPAFPLIVAQTICHQVLMKLLPAIIENNGIAFGQAITDIQMLIGDHFSPIQGSHYASQDVETIINYTKSLGHVGIAQSSWGPTSCVFVASAAAAEKLVTDLNQYIDKKFTQSPLELTIAKASNIGANIEIKTTEAR